MTTKKKATAAEAKAGPQAPGTKDHCRGNKETETPHTLRGVRRIVKKIGGSGQSLLSSRLDGAHPQSSRMPSAEDRG
jgi:hypothetical protein